MKRAGSMQLSGRPRSDADGTIRRYFVPSCTRIQVAHIFPSLSL
jgi:hypothetical protein